MRNNDIIEKLAAYEYDRWLRWQKYLFSKCIRWGFNNSKRICR